MMNALIIKATGSWYRALTGEGTTMECRLPGKYRLKDEEMTNPVAIGDQVNLAVQDDGTALIREILPRKNKLLRKATHGRRGVQLLAANIDQVLVVQSLLQPALKTGFTDRLLVSCEAYEMTPLLVINKTDLARTPVDKDRLKCFEDLYTGLGYRVLKTSIHDAQSLENLRSSLADRISVLSGPSGTGKSSLLNAIHPGLNLKTRDISRFSSKGKHTTTFAQLIELNRNTFIADTPGIREFGLVGIRTNEVSLYYPDMRPYTGSCRFYNCSHRHEPECAVRAAVDKGEISAERYKNYQNILGSLEGE